MQETIGVHIISISLFVERMPTRRRFIRPSLDDRGNVNVEKKYTPIDCLVSNFTNIERTHFGNSQFSKRSFVLVRVAPGPLKSSKKHNETQRNTTNRTRQHTAITLIRTRNKKLRTRKHLNLTERQNELSYKQFKDGGGQKLFTVRKTFEKYALTDRPNNNYRTTSCVSDWF